MSIPPPTPDRRAARRYAVRISADVRLAGRTVTTRTRNLSTAGVCLETSEPIAGGVALEIGLFLVTEDVEDPSVPSVMLAGTVAWSRPAQGDTPPLVGVRFDAPRPAQVALLTRYLELLKK